MLARGVRSPGPWRESGVRPRARRRLTASGHGCPWAAGRAWQAPHAVPGQVLLALRSRPAHPPSILAALAWLWSGNPASSAVRFTDSMAARLPADRGPCEHGRPARSSGERVWTDAAGFEHQELAPLPAI